MRSSPANIALLILFCFSLQAFCSVSLNLRSTSPTTNPSTPSTGEIQIQRDSNGFYINADLSDSSQIHNSSVKMSLSLSNHDVLLADSCLNFNQYPCDYYHCTEYSGTTKTVNYSNFNASTIEASASVYLDSQYWVLKENALIATECLSENSKNLGSGRYGVVGLGTEGSSKNNFLKEKLFSIYLDSDLQGGVLKFANDQKYASSWVGNITKVNENWVVPVEFGYIQVNATFPSFTGNLAFDINADVLGLPSELFDKVLYFIAETQWFSNITCSDDTYQPTCNYTGYLKNLPDLWLSTGNMGVRFQIPVEIYVKGVKSREDFVTSITLNMKALDPSLSGESFVTPEYANTIIMDARTMSSFYMVFDMTSGVNMIQVYQANPNATHSGNDPSNPDDFGWIYIGVICLIVVVVISVCCNAIVKRKRVTKSDVRGSQTPLIGGNNYVVSGYNYQ